MSDDYNPLPKVEQVVMDLYGVHWDKEKDEPKLTGWCGYEAWRRLMRHVSMLSMDIGRDPKFRAFSVWGCKFDKDPGQPVDDIVFQSNGAPVRRLNTATMNVEVLTGPAGVLSADIKGLEAVFRGDYAITIENPWVRVAHMAPLQVDDAPVFIQTRTWDMSDFLRQGLVHKTGERTYSLTLAGRNAIAQFNAFPA